VFCCTTTAASGPLLFHVAQVFHEISQCAQQRGLIGMTSFSTSKHITYQDLKIVGFLKSPPSGAKVSYVSASATQILCGSASSHRSAEIGN